MKRKQVIDTFTAVFLIITGVILLIFPRMGVFHITKIVLIVFSLYSLLNIIQFLLTYEDKDYEGLLTAIASIVSLIMTFVINIAEKPWNLALVLFVWIIMMSLIKLKKTDYYNDQNNKMWILRIVTLVLFIVTGILATINLYYTADIQILVLGFFFYVHGILELVDPIANYLIYSKKK